MEQIAVDVGGLRVAALADGPADGPLAVCLHGFPDTAHTWRHLLPALGGARLPRRGAVAARLRPDGPGARRPLRARRARRRRQRRCTRRSAATDGPSSSGTTGARRRSTTRCWRRRSAGRGRSPSPCRRPTAASTSAPRTRCAAAGTRSCSSCPTWPWPRRRWRRDDLRLIAPPVGGLVAGLRPRDGHGATCARRWPTPECLRAAITYYRHNASRRSHHPGAHRAGPRGLAVVRDAAALPARRRRRLPGLELLQPSLTVVPAGHDASRSCRPPATSCSSSGRTRWRG